MTDKTNAEGQEAKHTPGPWTIDDTARSSGALTTNSALACTDNAALRARVDELENTIEDLLKTKINLENELEFEKQVANSQVEITKEAQLEIEQVTSRVTDLEGALQGLMDMIENGTLVRNTKADYESGWAIKQLPLLKAIGIAKAALSKPPM